MAELAFVGLGLGDERGLSERAWDVLRTCGEVFAEEYTSVAPDGTLDRVSAKLHHRVQRLGRSLLESEQPILDALGRSDRVALIVVGDPFVATTHIALRLAVERAGHTWTYLPNASILTAAAGFLGFMHYRFGRTVSFPFPAPGFAPRSPVEQIAGNRERGLHTLVLLDLLPEDDRYLTANDALAVLRERDTEGAVVPKDSLVAVAARVGRDDAAGWFGPLEELLRVDFGPPMHVVIVPAPELHFEELAALARYRRRPRETTG
jgi:diphthine synthase